MGLLTADAAVVGLTDVETGAFLFEGKSATGVEAGPSLFEGGVKSEDVLGVELSFGATFETLRGVDTELSARCVDSEAGLLTADAAVVGRTALETGASLLEDKSATGVEADTSLFEGKSETAVEAGTSLFEDKLCTGVEDEDVLSVELTAGATFETLRGVDRELSAR